MAKRRATLKEIKAPDEFQEAMSKVVEFFRLYGGWVAAGGGVIVVGILLGVFLSRHQESAAIEKAVAFDKAASIVLKPSDPTATAPAAEAPSSEEFAGAATAITAFIEDNKRSKLARTAQLAKGTAALQAGDFAAAMAAFKAFAEAYPDSSLALTAWAGYGEAADRAGNRAEAEQAFVRLIESSQTLFQVNGHLHLGDLYHPTMSPAGADAAKARDHYEKGLAAVDGNEDDMPPAHLIARKTLQARLRSLP